MAFDDETETETKIPDAVDLGYGERPSSTPILDSLIGAVKNVGSRALRHVQHPITALGEDITEVGRQAQRNLEISDKWAKGRATEDEKKELIHDMISGVSGMGFAGSIKNIGAADKTARALETAATAGAEKTATPIVDSLTSAMTTSTGRPISGPGHLETIISKGRPKGITPPEAPPNILERLWNDNSQERDLTRGIL